VHENDATCEPPKLPVSHQEELGKMSDEHGLIILTGAASGIGRAAAEALAKKSRPLALVDIDSAQLNTVVALCRTTSPLVTGFACDVSDEASVVKIYQQIREQLGSPQVLINCAGIGRFAPFLEIEPAEWVRMFNVNVMGTVLLTRAVLPNMIAASAGTIINVGSRMAIDAHATTTAYAASKAAILAFSKALATEVSDKGVKITFLAPGGTKTNLATPKHDSYLEPSAVADAIVYITENSDNAWVRELVVLPLGF
jgi:3-oxoacyl-[acyl-carrier protein] reductase